MKYVQEESRLYVLLELIHMLTYFYCMCQRHDAISAELMCRNKSE